MMSRRDLDFLLHEWLDVSSLFTHEQYAQHDRHTVDGMLDLAELVAGRRFAPHNRRSDVEEPTFDGTTVAIHEEVAPALAANCATAAYPFLTKANANLLLAHATAEQVETWVRPMAEGRYFGTMCISEPQAGSSVGDVLTRATPEADGTYRIRGSKMWISGGDHELSDNIVHLVLARVVGAPPGVKGLSLFIVPKILPDVTRNDVSLAGLNHKMGMRGIANTLLSFGEQGGAVGFLVGEENRGLSYMFHMMNEARIGVGKSAVALGYAGYLHALAYAKGRPQGRPVDAKDPATAMVPIVEHPDVRRMLLAAKSYVEGGLALALYCGRLIDEERAGPDPESAHLLLEILTPIAKSWPSQWCLAANDLAIQVHGGYGYTREYPVEQLWRDNRLNPIHEGTHGIQALDLLGRKVIMQDGAALHLLAGRMRETIARASAAGGRCATHAATLKGYLGWLLEVTRTLWASGDAAAALADSAVYLEAFGHVVVAWLWLDVELVAQGDAALYVGKRAAAEYFFTRELPKVGPQLDLLEARDGLMLNVNTATL